MNTSIVSFTQVLSLKEAKKKILTSYQKQKLSLNQKNRCLNIDI